MGLVLLMFSLMLLLAVALRLAAGARHERAQTGSRRTGSGSTGTGRTVLRTVRRVNDVRAMARGPGAYGKRLARRAVFRSLRKW